MRELGRATEAEEALRLSFARGERQPGLAAVAAQELSALLFQAQRVPEAVQWIEQATTLLPDGAAIRADLGRAYARVGRHEEAAAAFAHAIRLGASAAALHFEHGVQLHTLERYYDAIESYRAARTAGFEDKRCYQQLGAALIALAHHQEAAEAYEGAVRLAPNDVQLRYSLGLCYREIGRRDLAMAQYRAIRPVDINAAEQLFRLIQG